MTKDELDLFMRELELDRRRPDRCPRTGYWAMAIVLALFLLTCGALYGTSERMCYSCGAWYDAKYNECPACYPNLAGDGHERQ